MAVKLISAAFLLFTLLDKTKVFGALKVNLLTATWLSFFVLCNTVMKQDGKQDSALGIRLRPLRSRQEASRAATEELQRVRHSREGRLQG